MRGQTHEHAPSVAPEPEPAKPTTAPTAPRPLAALGNRSLAWQIQQLRARGPEDVSHAQIQAQALAGIRTPSSAYPHGQQIQRAFGHHRIDELAAHHGPDAAASARAMHAEAYTSDRHVVFAGAPSLRTAAHEAAHAVLQRAGIGPSDGVGRPDDRYERHADAVADRVLAGQSSEALLDRLTPRGSTAGPAPAQAVQRRIRWDFSTWLNTSTATNLSTGRYYNDFVDPEYTAILALAKEYDDDDTKLQLTTDMQSFTTAAKGCSKTPTDWTTAVAALDTLVTTINSTQSAYKIADADDYRNTRKDSWATDPTAQALGAMDTLAKASTLAAISPPQGKNAQPDIPGIAWTAARTALPSALRNLLRDIYTSWSLGQVMDERDQTAQSTKEKNSSTPGALRSWHMSEQGQLPDIASGKVPTQATALHQHYTNTSVHPYDKTNTSGPIGYAEYTGTGILNDAHNSKIVLDYKSGLIYLTVSHYQLWSVDSQNKYSVGGKNAGSGTHSAWFYIDMNK